MENSHESHAVTLRQSERVPTWWADNESVTPYYRYTHQEGWDLKAFCGFLYRRRRLIASVFLGFLLLGVALILTSKRMYTASTTILVEPSSPQILNVKELETGEPPGIYAHDFYETEYGILKSRSLAIQVIQQLDLMNNRVFLDGYGRTSLIEHYVLQRLYASTDPTTAAELSNADGSPAADQHSAVKVGIPPVLLDKYQNALTITPNIGTRLVTVSYTAPDPRLAAEIANTHVQAYIKRGMELHSEAARQAEAFLEKKLTEIGLQVEKSEAELNAYRRSRGIVSASIGDEGSKVLLQRLTELNANLNKTEELKIYLESEHQQILHGDYESLPEVIRSPLIQQLKEEVDRLAAQYASMRNRFNPGYHALDDLHAKLIDSQARLHREIDILVDGVEEDYSIQVARERKLNAEIGAATAQAMARNDASLHDAVLVRQVATNRSLYENVLRRMEEIGLTANRPSSNVSIVDRAQVPQHPSSPKILLDLASAAVLGLFGGIGLSFLQEHFDDSFKNKTEVHDYLRVPSVGQVPDFASLGRIGQGSRYYNRGGVANGKIGFHPDQPWPAAEAFRVIRNTILFTRSETPPRTILFTSAMSGEGKTSTAINTAIAFAQTGTRTVLIDADLRRAKCHEILGVENVTGLTERLFGHKATEEVIQPTQFEGLWLLSAGSEVSCPGEMLASSKMRALVAELGEKFDYVLIDSAPLIPVSDTEGLATLVDAVIVVANSKSSKQIVQDACSRLELVGAKIFGVVLNRVNPEVHYYSYSYRRSDSEKTSPGEAGVEA